jgi:hypothetical protein
MSSFDHKTKMNEDHEITEDIELQNKMAFKSVDLYETDKGRLETSQKLNFEGGSDAELLENMADGASDAGLDAGGGGTSKGTGNAALDFMN